MKYKQDTLLTRGFGMATVSASLLFGASSFANEAAQPADRSADQPERQTAESREQNPKTQFFLASSQHGRDVVDSNGEVIGEISDHAVNLEDGSIAFTLISSGGFLGMGGETRALPADNLRWEDGRYRADLTQSEFNQRDTLPNDLNTFLNDPENRRSLRGDSPSQQAPSSGDLILISSLTDETVRLSDEAYLGEVRDVAISPEESSVGYVQVFIDGVPSMMLAENAQALNLYLLPLSQLTDASADELQFDLSMTDLRDAEVIDGTDQAERSMSERGVVYAVASN